MMRLAPTAIQFTGAMLTFLRERKRSMENSSFAQSALPTGSRGRWWPADLGAASSDAESSDLRYAYFHDKHRLVIEDAGERNIFDTGEHDIMRVTRCRYGGIVFTSQLGKFMLPCLVKVA
jgi:hypothetical protein